MLRIWGHESDVAASVSAEIVNAAYRDELQVESRRLDLTCTEIYVVASKVITDSCNRLRSAIVMLAFSLDLDDRRIWNRRPGMTDEEFHKAFSEANSIEDVSISTRQTRAEFAESQITAYNAILGVTGTLKEKLRTELGHVDA